MFDYPKVPNSPLLLVTVFAGSRRGGFRREITRPYPQESIESTVVSLGNVQG